MQEKGSSAQGLSMIGIAALFLAGFFLLVVFGAQSYRNTVQGQNGNMDARGLQSYLSTTMKGYDRADEVSVVRDGEFGDVLVFADGSGYALRVYRKDSALLEEYAAEDAALDPERAVGIAETSCFEVEEGDGLLTVYTDAGRVLLHPRSEGGAQ